MRFRCRRWAIGLALAVLAAQHGTPRGWADTVAPITMRAGDHLGFGRVVFDFGGRVGFRQERDGDTLVLRFVDGMPLVAPSRMPRNVRAVTAGAGEAGIVLAQGARAQVGWLGDHLVVDVFDTAATAPPGPPPAPRPVEHSGSVAPPRTTAAAPLPARPRDGWPHPPPVPDAQMRPAQMQPALAQPAPKPPAPKPPAPIQPPPTQPIPTATEAPDAAQSPPATPQGPVTLAAAKTMEPAPAGASLTIPFSATTGAAAFRRGDTAVVVFDERRPVDLSGLQGDPVFSSATVQLLPNATVLRFRLPAGQDLSLAHDAQIWRVSVGLKAPALRPVALQVADGQVALPVDAPGGVVTVTDPDAGELLLVGTQQATGQGMPAGHRTPEFDLLPTWQGVVVVPLADNLSLRATPRGLVLTGGPRGLSLSPTSTYLQAEADAAGLTRRFDLRRMPPDALLRRLRDQVDAAAAAPPLGRGPPREAAATTMIALGWGAEAGAMLRLAAADDPALGAMPEATGLTAVAALLAGRPSEADGITDPRLTGSDEVSLWRAVRDAMRTPGSASSAAGFATAVPLIEVYPDMLRARLLRLAAETMVEGGQTDAAARLLAAHPDDPRLALARGMLGAINGDTDGALAILDALTTGPDQRLHALAGARAVELRLSAGRIDAGQAADALERLIYAWRGGRRELALRERVAELRQQGGAWRLALAALRQAEALFPDDKDAIRARMKDCFAALLRGDQVDHLPPLELVALIDENTDLLPDGDAGQALQERLADRLLALDLPQRAGPILEKLMHAAPTPTASAGFGARLAASRLRDGDPRGALAALAVAGAVDLPAPMAESRALIAGAAHARLGETQAAVASLASVGTAATDAARAGILEQARDWNGAEHAWGDYVARVAPGSGALDDAQQRILVRYATAAAQAGDDTMLATLRTSYGPRMPVGTFGEMFRLLTAEPVHGLADLPRAGRETSMARDLSKGLGALRSSTATQ
jgi:hypothetical protein